ATVTASPEDTLLAAHGRMKLYDISQLPVVDTDGKVIGLVDEEDILYRVMADTAAFRDKVESAMTARLETLQADQPLDALKPVFEKGHVAIVMDGPRFLGL